MPLYPSSLYKNATRSGNGLSNDPGSYLMNNYTTYQELRDTVVGVGISIVVTGNTLGVSTPHDYDGTNLYNSAAKYPTDVRVGITTLTNSTHFWSDFVHIAENLRVGIATFSANSTQISTDQLKTIAGSYVGQYINKLSYDMQKVSYRLNILSQNIDRLDSGLNGTAGGATTAIGQYPSSKNRYSNTAGGI